MPQPGSSTVLPQEPEWVMYRTAAEPEALQRAANSIRSGRPACVDLQDAHISCGQHLAFMRSLVQLLRQPGTVLKLMNCTWDMAGWPVDLPEAMCIVSGKVVLQHVHFTGFGQAAAAASSMMGNRAARRQASRNQKKQEKKGKATAAPAQHDINEIANWSLVQQFLVLDAGSLVCRDCTWAAPDPSTWVFRPSAVTAVGTGATAVLEQCEITGYAGVANASEGAMVKVLGCTLEPEAIGNLVVFLLAADQGSKLTVQRSTVTAAYRPHSMYTWLLYAKEGGHFEATDSQFWLDQTAQASNPHFAAGSGIMTVAEGSTGLISGCEITWVGGHEPQSPAVGVTEDSELEMGGCQLRAAKVCANQAKICMQKCSFKDMGREAVNVMNGSDVHLEDCKFERCGTGVAVPAPEPDDGRALMPVRVRMERCQVKGFGQSALHILSPAAVVDVVKCLIEANEKTTGACITVISGRVHVTGGLLHNTSLRAPALVIDGRKAYAKLQEVAVYVPFNNAGVVVQGGGSFSAVDCCFCPDKEPDDAMTSGFGIKLMDSATACLGRCELFKLEHAVEMFGSASLKMVGCCISGDRIKAVAFFPTTFGSTAPCRQQVQLVRCSHPSTFQWSRPNISWNATHTGSLAALQAAYPLGTFTESEAASSAEAALGRPPRAPGLMQAALRSLKLVTVSGQAYADLCRQCVPDLPAEAEDFVTFLSGASQEGLQGRQLDRHLNSGDSSQPVQLAPECVVCGKPGPHLVFCRGCKMVRYCGEECQTKDWEVHKQLCAQLRTKAWTQAGAAGGAGHSSQAAGEGSSTAPQAASTSAGSSSSGGHESRAAVQQCAECGATGVPLSRCAGCKQAWYCGQECQKAHWPAHKATCQQLRKAK